MAWRIRHSTQDETGATPRGNAHPLFWLLVLAAFLAIVWMLYNRYASEPPPPLMTTPPPKTTAATRAVSRIVDAEPLRPQRTGRPPRP
ncbi:hypothetical protein [Cognatiluteimonas profundi]|uniref:hypothetical protein n=1 Tax=Cognatiluteimonas profundi TaxID=2594501 RepID=UPI00131A9626|nr:hypothetical protein [Lysobacter profundi]